MIINPKSKSVTYSLDSLEQVELSIEDIERQALADNSISGEVARDIVSALNSIRDNLGLKRGVSRHPKFATQS